ncbi:peptidylprolyl isomerase [Streptococcus infantarius subsp. infantarius]|nr:peptidylprolyl isomerase [Streptococcus infantarius subsp. infantarius]
MANKEKSGFSKMIQSKAFKGVSIAVASALIGAGVTYLATNNNSETKALVTMKGNTITVSDFYNAAKSTSSSQQTMLNLVLSRVFEDQYGDKVSDKDVTKAYNTTASSYGSSFSSALQAAGLTTDTYKQQIRTSMLVEYAVKEAAKDKLTTKNYKDAYKDYNADTTATVIALTDEDKANSVHNQATADGADFDKIAKENTTAKKTEYTFDSADTKLPSDVMADAFKQDEGSVSDVIKVMNSSTYSYTYYIVKTTKKTEKNADWKTYKKRLKKIIMAKYQNDTSFQNQVISKALDKANVKIKDRSFASILSQYATSTSSSSSKASSSSSEASSSEASSTEDSSTAESSSTDSAE